MVSFFGVARIWHIRREWNPGNDSIPAYTLRLRLMKRSTSILGKPDCLWRPAKVANGPSSLEETYVSIKFLGKAVPAGHLCLTCKGNFVDDR